MGRAEFSPPRDPTPGASGLPPGARGTVVTVGTFDGIHPGHWEVLREIRRRADDRDAFSVLVTFDRHPLTVVRPDEAPKMLTSPDEKKEILAQSGLDFAAFLPFTRSLSLYQPEEFVRYVLVERFRVAELVVGYDHGFGRGRSGDTDTLEEMGRELGFEVDVVGEVDAEGEAVSSTRIRELVARGEVAEASRVLGRPYSFRSTVVHGEGRGSDLGFPTANLRPPGGRKLLPPSGIYAVRAALRTEIRTGLLHAGPRPTFAGSPPSLELYLLEFDREIYGKTVRVEFLERFRDVRPFGSTDELVEQMKEDRARAREFFAGRGEA